MSDPSFATAFTVQRTPRAVYDAVTNVRGWWSEEVEGGTAEVGDEFTYRYEEVHRCRIRVTEAVPGRRVSWLVLENHFDFTGDQTEWVGTTISFDIAEEDGATRVAFTHRGLVPEHECFDVCAGAWGFYLTSSLPDLITTGEGRPNRRGRPSAPAEAAAAREAVGA
jgi:hypothetical protein